MFIALLDYFGDWFDDPRVTDEIKDNARVLLEKVNGLLLDADANNVELRANPSTCTYMYGETAFGDWRFINIFDPDDALDRWLTIARLSARGLCREAPADTKGYCRLSERAA